MSSFKHFIHRVNSHFLWRNIVFAVSGILVFLFVVSVLLNFFTRHGQQYEVPDFVGRQIGQTDDLTDAADLQLVVIDSLFVSGGTPGEILDQNPSAASRVKSGRKIFVVINATNPKTEVIPYVTGYSLRQAKNMLENRGFQIERLIYRSDMANNNVIGESFKGREITKASRTEAPMGSGIVLTVGRSEGAPLPSTPKVIGLTLRETKSRLWEVGLNIGEVYRDADVTSRNEDQALVYKQTPGQQIRTDYGSKVSVYLTTDSKKVSESSKKSDSEARKQPAQDDSISDEELEKLLQESL